MRKLILTALAAMLMLSLAVCANAAEAFVYEDTASGNQLILPGDWDLEYEEDAFVKVTFLPQNNVSARMQYGSRDLNAGANARRENLNNSHYGPNHVAELVGCTARDVKRITLGGTEYFRAAFEKKVESGEFTIPLRMTYWVRYDQGWVYVYQYIGNDSSPQYQQFKDMIVHASYAEAAPVDPQEQTYQEAVAAYEGGSYEAAETAFQALGSYQDSSKYLRLLRIRSAGGNAWLGSGEYKKELALTAKDKQDIDEAAADFAFADTAQVLLCNSDVAAYYLDGTWSGGGPRFLRFKSTDTGSTYSIGTPLSKVKSDSFSIENGEFRIHADGKDSAILKLTLTAPDTLEVVSYEMDNESFTLKRSSLPSQ